LFLGFGLALDSMTKYQLMVLAAHIPEEVDIAVVVDSPETRTGEVTIRTVDSFSVMRRYSYAAPPIAEQNQVARRCIALAMKREFTVPANDYERGLTDAALGIREDIAAEFKLFEAVNHDVPEGEKDV
jgi:hypothetical protein